MSDGFAASTPAPEQIETAGGKHPPFVCNQVVLSQAEYIQLKWDANYWKAQHERSCAREERLKKKLARKEAQVRDLKQRLFGEKSEKGTIFRDQSGLGPGVKRRPRGQQKGSRGHGRTERPHLRVEEEQWELTEQACCCTQCGLPYDSFPGTEDSEIVEVEVRAYKRRVKRQRYKKGCRCPDTRMDPGLISAPTPPKVISRSPYGISVWEQVLLNKFLHAQPLHGILQDLKGLGLPIAQGTLTGGLQKIAALFEPIHRALYVRQMGEQMFHNDESRWEVYEAVEGKVGHRWYLWVTRSPSVIYYRMDPSRSAEVPMSHFGALKGKQAIVVCDRYSAYKKLARSQEGIILAFCWAHVRRDFLDLARSYPELKDWGLDWVETIGQLYELNQTRLDHWHSELVFEQQGLEFQQAHTTLKTHLQQMKARCDTRLQVMAQAKDTAGTPQSPEPYQPWHRAQRKVLRSLEKHWEGLTIFLAHPQVPLDNNAAEQAIRSPVTGRKNYYGSGSIWSAQLAAIMFSIFQTLGLWKLNTRHWLRAYLVACAGNGGQAPTRLNPFLPWEMGPRRRQQLSRPPDTS